MRLLQDHLNEASLRKLACEAVDLLVRDEFELLVGRFGYAIALGRNPVEAVKADCR